MCIASFMIVNDEILKMLIEQTVRLKKVIEISILFQYYKDTS